MSALSTMIVHLRRLALISNVLTRVCKLLVDIRLFAKQCIIMLYVCVHKGCKETHLIDVYLLNANKMKIVA